MSPVPIGLGTLLETARSALAHGAPMELGRKDTSDKNPSPNEDLVPAHPADKGHKVQSTQKVYLPWRAEDLVRSVTGTGPKTKMALLHPKLSLLYRPK